MRHDERDDYQAWLWGEVLLIGLLGAALALFVANPSLRSTYALPHVRLVLDTAVMLAPAIVALLAVSASRSTAAGSTCCCAAASAPWRRRRSRSPSHPCSGDSRCTGRRRGRGSVGGSSRPR
jgi:hypothetical protein